MAEGDASLRLTGNQPSTIETLRKEQTRFGRIQEVQFHSVDGFPDLSKTTRMIAHTSRTIHSNCVALFRRYHVHGGHILNTLIPMLKEGIDLNEPSITAGSLESCHQVVTELLNETTKVNKNYAELVPRLKQLKQDILRQNEATDKKARDLRAQLTTAKQTEYNIELRQRTEAKRSEYGQPLPFNDTDYTTETFLEPKNILLTLLFVFMLCVVCATDQSTFRVLFGLLTLILGIYIVSEYLWITKANDNARQRRSYASSSGAAAFASTEDNSAQLRQLKYEISCLEREIEATNGKFLIVDQAEKAVVILTGILQQMDRLIGFWQRMLGNIKPLATPAGAADIHQKTRREDLHDTFFHKLALTESGWRKFGDACAAYIQFVESNGDERCNVVYQFLSAPIGTPKHELDARIATLLRQI